MGLDIPEKMHGALCAGGLRPCPSPQAGELGKRLASGDCPLVLGTLLCARVSLPRNLEMLLSWQHAGTVARSSSCPEQAGHQGAQQSGEVSPGLARMPLTPRAGSHGPAGAPGGGDCPAGLSSLTRSCLCHMNLCHSECNCFSQFRRVKNGRHLSFLYT